MRLRIAVAALALAVLSASYPALRGAEPTPAELYVIDEIGKMELFSQRFRTALIDLLARPSNLLATIAKKGKGFIEQIKGRNDIELIEVTRENRDHLAEEVVRKIKAEFGTVNTTKTVARVLDS